MKTAVSGIVLALLLMPARPMFAFTQRAVTGDVPVDHEWITRVAAIEVFGGGTIPPDPRDPRVSWTASRKARYVAPRSAKASYSSTLVAERISDTTYHSVYQAVHDAIMGNRWVDLNGFDAAFTPVCWDSVVQNMAVAQPSHFLRGIHDEGAERRRAGHPERARTIHRVLRGGRHRSPHEHGDQRRRRFGLQPGRGPAESFPSRARGARSAGFVQHRAYRPQHARHIGHSQFHVRRRDLHPADRDGGTGPADVDARQPHETVGARGDEGSVGRIRHGHEHDGSRARRIARREAETIANLWLSYNETEVREWYTKPENRGPTYVGEWGRDGRQSADCARDARFATTHLTKLNNDFIEPQRRHCIYNVWAADGYNDLFDTVTQMPYAWQWRRQSGMDTPPFYFVMPQNNADSGRRVTIRHASGCAVAADSLAAEQWLYCRSGVTPTEFVLAGGPDHGWLRIPSKARLFFSYRGSDGYAKLYESPSQAALRFERLSNGRYLIYNLSQYRYMWLDGEWPKISWYNTRQSAEATTSTQWVVEELP